MFTKNTINRFLDSSLVQSVALYCLTALLIVSLSGCGETPIPSGTLSGTIKHSGNPYGNVRLIFLSMDSGQAGTADVSEDGAFEMSDALPVGEYVAYLAPIPPETDSEQPAPEVIDESIPQEYWNESTSKLRVTIDEGENQVGLVID